MSRYIDADKLKSEFDYEHIDMNKTAAFIHHCHILEIINQQPTADVVKVVRCKDCKYNAKQDNESKFRNICTLRRPLVYVPVSDEDYCSRGETKDE